VRFEFESGTAYFVLPLSLFWLDNHVCLSRDVQLAGATCRVATRIMVGVGDLVQRIRDGRTDQILDNRMIGRSSDTVCGMHCAHRDKEHGCLG
jgi:hypothetical protein